jgi:hypothetical protein
MSRHLRLLAPPFALFTCAASAQPTNVNSVLEMNEFIQDWKISQITLEVANAMLGELRRITCPV